MKFTTEELRIIKASLDAYWQMAERKNDENAMSEIDRIASGIETYLRSSR